MLIYRGELITGPAALPRLLLRELIYEKVLVGPVVPDFHGPVARLVELPTGGLRIDWWVKGSGWVEAPKGAFDLGDFMPGYTRPASAKDAARFDIPAAELDDVTPFEIELEKHEMRRPRKIYGLLWGTELPSSRDRAKLVLMLKARAWDLAVRRMAPGNA
jgi:hypothetical protein